MNRTIYKNARIFTGIEIIENGILVVEHSQKDFIPPVNGEAPVKVAPSVTDKIIYVGSPDCYSDSADEVIDVAGNTIIPGLVCADTRLDTLNPAADDRIDNIGIAFRTILSYRSAAEALNTGVTTLKAIGMPNNIDIALKNAISKTMFFGPDILATGPVYGVTAGKGSEKYGMIQASGTDDLRAQMRIHLSRGLDGVTLQISGNRLTSLNGEYQKQMTDSEICALVKHAHGAEKTCAVNASGDVSVKAALEAGADIIQQGYRISNELLAEMAAKGTVYVPCLVSTLDSEIHEEHMDTVRRAIASGVTVVVGTEILPSQPIDGTTAMLREMELFVEAGLTPTQAIQSATLKSAKTVHSKAGCLKAGGVADFLIVAGNPNENISALRNLLCVVRSGRRAFCLLDGKERQFHIHAPLYEVCGGNTIDWTQGALIQFPDPPSFNTSWNLMKEI